MRRKSRLRRHWQFSVQLGHSQTSVLLAVTYLHSFIRRIRKIMWVMQTRGIPIALAINVLQAIAQKQANSATGLLLSMKVFR